MSWHDLGQKGLVWGTPFELSSGLSSEAKIGHAKPAGHNQVAGKSSGLSANASHVARSSRRYDLTGLHGCDNLRSGIPQVNAHFISRTRSAHHHCAGARGDAIQVQQALYTRTK